MDKGEELDMIWFREGDEAAQNASEEFIQKIIDYKATVIQVFGSQYPQYIEQVENRFEKENVWLVSTLNQLVNAHWNVLYVTGHGSMKRSRDVTYMRLTSTTLLILWDQMQTSICVATTVTQYIILNFSSCAKD